MTSNFLDIDLPYRFTNDESNVDNLLDKISIFLNTEDVNVLNVFKHYNKAQTETVTTRSPASNLYRSSPSSISSIKQNSTIGKLFSGLSMNDIRVLLAILMTIDLDRNGTPDIFNLIEFLKTSIYEKGGTMDDISTYKNREPSSYLKKSVRDFDSELYEHLFSKNYEKSTSYVPGFSYTPPQTWRRESDKPPMCMVDKRKVNNPAFVFDSGVPANALDFESIRMLPQFRYYESETPREYETMKKLNDIDAVCSTYCKNNCDLPICEKLNCESCSRQ